MARRDRKRTIIRNSEEPLATPLRPGPAAAARPTSGTYAAVSRGSVPSGISTLVLPWVLRHSLLVVLVVTAVVRLVHLGFMAASDPFFSSLAPGTDMETYWNQGRAIAGGDLLLRSFSGPFYYGPLYSYFLAPIIALFGERLHLVHYVQFLLGLAVPALAWYTARRLDGNRAGLVAGLLAGLCVPLIYWNQTVLVEGLNLTLISGATVLLVLATQREKLRGEVDRTAALYWAVSGALLGLAVSGRGNTLLVIFGIIMFRAAIPIAAPAPAAPSAGGVLPGQPNTPKLSFWGARRQSSLLAAVFFAGALVTLALPIGRNLVVAGKFAITTNGPALLYIGNYRDAIGVLTSSPHLEELMKKYSGEPPYMDELGRDIAADPMHLVSMQWTKFLIFMSAYDAPDNFSLDLYARYSPILKYNPVGWALVVALGGLGVWHLRRRLGPRGDLWPLTALLILFPMSVIPILVVGRYRLPWLFPLMILGGVGTSVLVDRVRNRGRQALILPGLWLVAVILLTLPRWSPASYAITTENVPPRFIRPNDWVSLAEGMRDAGWPQDRWMAVYRDGVNENPESPMIVYRVGKLLLDQNRASEAIPILDRYMQLQRADSNGAKLLASALIIDRRAQEALPILEQIVRIYPEDQDARLLLNQARARVGSRPPGHSP